MKQIFSFVAIAAMVCFASCQKGGNTNNGGSGNGGKQQEEYVAPITIDGEFDDWAAIESKATTLTCATNNPKQDLKKAMVYSDKYYVFVYVEFDYTAYDGAPTDVHFDFVINGDNDTSTGGYMGSFAQGETPCVDLLVQGDLIVGGELAEAYDPFVGTWSGDANGDGWSWTEVEGLTGFVEGKGTKKVWEFQITRELYPAGKLAKEFTMGLFASINGWNATGVLPNVEPTEENAEGYTNLMTVSLSK